MIDVRAAVDAVAGDHDFSGVVRVEVAHDILVDAAYGFAERRLAVPNRTDTIFAIASGCKGLTALTVASLVEDGSLTLDTTARSVLGDDLPLIDDSVTVDHLLTHRSGIGDYVDEDTGGDIEEHVLTVPVHTLDRTERYVPALDGLPAKFTPGERFSYCNGGYVVLALIVERVSGIPFGELVAQRVCRPAGMSDTAFLRSDELPPRAAIGYLAAGGGQRTNIFHLPVLGSGDGGAYSTAADIRSLWTSLFAGAIVAPKTVEHLTTAQDEATDYGRGFWVPAGRVALEGFDAGVSFRSFHDPASDLTATVMSNTSGGAWPLARLLEDEWWPDRGTT
jgi:CubicO group peptidase (beta-lactamase class C family)